MTSARLNRSDLDIFYRHFEDFETTLENLLGYFCSYVKADESRCCFVLLSKDWGNFMIISPILYRQAVKRPAPHCALQFRDESEMRMFPIESAEEAVIHVSHNQTICKLETQKGEYLLLAPRILFGRLLSEF